MLAVQADGATITTVEGLAPDGELTPLQRSFSEHHALQCGYCTPGMLMSATALLAHTPHPTEDEVRVALQGNICRCTGYVNIVEAVVAAGGASVTARPSTESHDRAAEGVRRAVASRARRTAGSSRARGVFVDDVKRHGMGYVHFVRSPYAHAKIVSIDVSAALELDGVYGTLTGDEVAILTDPFFEMSVAPGNRDQGLRARRRQGAPHGRAGRGGRAPRRESSRATPPSSSRSSTSRCRCSSTARRRSKDEVVLHDDAGSNVVWSGVFDWGDWEQAKAEADHVVTIEQLHFDRFSSTPLECCGRPRRVRPRHAASGRSTATTRCPASARSGWRPALRTGHRQAALRHPGHRRRLRQQDLPRTRSSSRCCLLARKLEPAGAVDGVAHRPAHGERARQRAHVPRRRGRREGRRHAARASTSRRSTTAARSRATSRSAASSGRRSRPAATAGRTSASTSRRSARTSRRCRRTAATRACSTSG